MFRVAGAWPGPSLMLWCFVYVEPSAPGEYRPLLVLCFACTWGLCAAVRRAEAGRGMVIDKANITLRNDVPSYTVRLVDQK